jgi:hypothetical protein
VEARFMPRSAEALPITRILPARRAIMAGAAARNQSRQGIDQCRKHLPPFGFADLDRRRRWSPDRQVGNQDIDVPGLADDPRRRVDFGKVRGTGDDVRALFGENLAEHRAHELGGLGDENALAGQYVLHDGSPGAFRRMGTRYPRAKRRCAERGAVRLCGLGTTGRVVDALGGRRVVGEFVRRPPRAGDQFAPAVRTPAAEFFFGTAGAEGAFEGADARLRGVGRQVPVTAFAVRPELQHGGEFFRL